MKFVLQFFNTSAYVPIAARAGFRIDRRWRKGLQAIAAVSRWKFQPTPLNGKPIDTAITVTAEFGTER